MLCGRGWRYVCTCFYNIFYYRPDQMRDSKSSLKNIRVLKKNMLFIQSYDDEINKCTLKSHSFYETCGSVEKIKLKENYKNHTAYVTYQDAQSAAAAFIALFHLNHRMKILFGTVQYCKYFIRRSECRNDQCVFLHLRDRKNQIIVKDEIDEDVYEEHYDMAFKIAQDEAFETIKKILAKRDIAEENLIRKGLKKAAEMFNILADLKLEVICATPQRKLSELQESLGSTTEQSINQCREEPLSIETPNSQAPPNIPEDSESTSLPQSQSVTAGQCLQKNSLNTQSELCCNSKQKRNDFSLGEYIKIQLIKKIIRENKSKMHSEDTNREQFNKRGNMMLYKIVKK